MRGPDRANPLDVFELDMQTLDALIQDCFTATNDRKDETIDGWIVLGITNYGLTALAGPTVDSEKIPDLIKWAYESMQDEDV